MRRVSWIKLALKEFGSFPQAVQEQMKFAMEIAAAGQKADIAKPMKGLGPGVFELAVAHRGDAFRAVYVLLIDDDVWVVHAFQKKSTQGIKTPRREIDVIRERIRRIRDMPR